jgi:hypothetical protein
MAVSRVIVQVQATWLLAISPSMSLPSLLPPSQPRNSESQEDAAVAPSRLRSLISCNDAGENSITHHHVMPPVVARQVLAASCLHLFFLLL